MLQLTTEGLKHRERMSKTCCAVQQKTTDDDACTDSSVTVCYLPWTFSLVWDINGHLLLFAVHMHAM